MARLDRDNRYFLYLTDDERNEINSMVGRLITLRTQFANELGGYTWFMYDEGTDTTYDDDDFQSALDFLNFLTSDDVVVEK